ncbi:CidA/LrgA family protein [Paracoccus limosus]|uniref:CidA/LrgA family protein n=1 Tax=Paracoccus limosus TaxID=913252 RepID=A0A844H4T2_9RHOB|nr:CidA/LrgA family protein [Paracoccus limosus]MTH33507.1 CidA/LrgA family protein [Paracoccus limosus]
MIPALLILLSFQLAGEVAARSLGLSLPGPVLGLVALVLSCSLRPALAERLRPVVLGLLGNLSLFFVPAGVGVVAHLGEFRSDGLAIAVALMASTALAIAVAALVFVQVVRLTGRGKAEVQE